MRRADVYQWFLILSLLAAAVLTGAFLYREIYPQYQIFQHAYVELENFRSTYTGEPPPAFKIGIKQIVIPRPDGGPETIDRCTSCHVALDVPHYSPTRIAHDVNGNVMVDLDGNPLQEANPDYIWGKLDEKISLLTSKGDTSQAEKLSALKTTSVNGVKIDMTKVLSMHPLIGAEQHPFEFHHWSEYGCTICHGGNGRGLTLDKAHGPVFDSQYEYEFEGYTPEFTESDPENDPKFAKIFNHKPNYKLLFQTTPILPGPLVQSRCVQCHHTTNMALDQVTNQFDLVVEKKGQQTQAIRDGIANGTHALLTLMQLYQAIQEKGYANAMADLEKKAHEYTLSETDQNEAAAQEKYLSNLLQPGEHQKNSTEAQQRILNDIQQRIEMMVGSMQTAQQLVGSLSGKQGSDLDQALVDYFKNHPQSTGSLFAKAAALNLHQDILQHVKDSEHSFQSLVGNQSVISSMQSDIDLLTNTYNEGENLYITQACYACHRISGFARGGVGPELTKEGLKYPWFIKQSIVWPQADLRTSTMPNMTLDHEELEALTTFLLGQRGENKAIASFDYKAKLKDWEEGKPAPWEKPLPPDKIFDVRNSMIIFATEGCASCHRLQGYESNVGYRIEKENKTPSFDDLYREHEWFESLFPENIIGSKIVSTLEKRWKEIDDHIVANVRQNSILEEIEAEHPGVIESFYANFKYAARGKNQEFTQRMQEGQKVAKEWTDWKERVHRVLMMYIQEYGLGRLIGPRPNWSGIFRSDQWLMEHFHNPAEMSPKSLMPVFPFDESKFYALTYMLDQLARKNRDQVHQIWEHRGFNPELAYQIHCAQCHGDFRHGNGPIAEWLYPLPKNLSNPIFLRNLTRERAMQSIEHGIKGTPMPPWGEVAKPDGGEPVLNEKEIKSIVEWLFFNVPGQDAQDVLKWHYTPQDVIQELKAESNQPGINLESLFAIEPPLVPGPEKHAYFIKQKYYTPQNLQAGQAFFELNCAICHGKEADGTGLRAEAMIDAKPMMLTNINWLNTRDDLRLLRSIKYGVPGTAMTPWGDLTTSLQRLQLVMYIRSLSVDHREQRQMTDALFHIYNRELDTIETLRGQRYTSISDLTQRLDEVHVKRESLYKQSIRDPEAEKQLSSVYGEEINLKRKLEQEQEQDKLLTQLSDVIAKEKNLYSSLGSNYLLRKPSKEEFDLYINILKTFPDRYRIADDRLVLLPAPEPKERMLAQNRLLDLFDTKIKELVDRKKDSTGEQLVSINAEITAYEKLKAKMITGFTEADRIRQEEEKIYHEIEKGKE